MPERCVEYFDKLPTTTEHLWRGDIHGIPVGRCLKCGEPIESYNQRWTAAILALEQLGRVEIDRPKGEPSGLPGGTYSTGPADICLWSDAELRIWISNAHKHAGSFLMSLAETAFRADDENYRLLRPVLLAMKAKYPKYDERPVNNNE